MPLPAPPAPIGTAQDRAHDLRNLFAVISSSTHLLQDRATSDGQAMLLHAIDRAASCGAAIAGDILAGIDDGMPRRADLNSVVADLQPILTGLLGPRHRLRLDLCADALPLALDAPGLDNVLVELVLNARRALATRGCVTVRTRRVGARSWLLVADDGHGVPRAQWPRLKQRDRRPQGLPRIARWLATVQGHLHWRSRPAAGTVVAIDLPLALGRRNGRKTTRLETREDSHGSAFAA
ncbi:MAG: sensor histidine kinase [Sphingomonas sp.]